MTTFRVHFKNGSSITVTAHHFGFKPAVAGIVPFYKDETTLDENIFIASAEVLAIVPEAAAPGVAAGNVTRSSSSVRSR